MYSNFNYFTIKEACYVARYTTFFKCKDNHIHVKCGCFSGTSKQFEKKVKETHGYNKYGREYLKIIEVIKIHFCLEE